MKIISKFKDYYDYLQGVWGMDEKLALDRTDYSSTPDYTTNTSMVIDLVRFYVCGVVVEGVYYQEKANKPGEFLYGEQIEKVLADRIMKEKYGWMNKETHYYIEKVQRPRYGSYYLKVLKKPTKFFDIDHTQTGYYKEKKAVECPNNLLDCPILIEGLPQEMKYDSSKCSKHPILKDYALNKVFSAQDMWIMLCEWLGRVKEIPNNQTNQEKIVSNGFDLKTSFRHPVK